MKKVSIYHSAIQSELIYRDDSVIVPDDATEDELKQIADELYDENQDGDGYGVYRTVDYCVCEWEENEPKIEVGDDPDGFDADEAIEYIRAPDGSLIKKPTEEDQQ